MAFQFPYRPFAALSDDDLVAALTKIEAAEIAFVEGQGQRTASIGSVSFTYGSRVELARIKAALIAAYNSRVEGANKAAPYKITHLMR